MTSSDITESASSFNHPKSASFLHGLKSECLCTNTYRCHDMSFLYSIQEHSTNATLNRSSQASLHIVLYPHKKWFSNDSSSQGHEGPVICRAGRGLEHTHSSLPHYTSCIESIPSLVQNCLVIIPNILANIKHSKNKTNKWQHQ